MRCFQKLLNKNRDSLNNTHFPVVNSLHGVNSQYRPKKIPSEQTRIEPQ